MLHLVQDIIATGMSLWHIRGTLQNAMASPREYLIVVYLRILINSLLSLFSGIAFSAYKLVTGEKCGHDVIVTVLFVVRWSCFFYSAWIFAAKVVCKVAVGTAELEESPRKRRYSIAVWCARWFYVPAFFGGVGFKS